VALFLLIPPLGGLKLKNTKCWLRTLLLGASIVAPAAIVGCAAHVSYYDPGYRDYHHWGPGEDHYYRQYLGERHENYHAFNKSSKDQQADYWKWRHDHPGN